MSLPAQPASRDEVLAQLAEYKADDPPVHGGRVLAYVYDAGIPDLDDVANAALTMYAAVNALDPTVFPSVALIENDLVGWGLDLLRGGEQAQGLVTSGGTESCMLAVKAGREHWRQRVGPDRAYRERGVVVLPVTAHSAFVKGAAYFDLDVRMLPVDPETFRVRVDDVRTALDELGDSAALVVVSAPSYAHGVVDPVADVAALGAERGVPVHSDACIGGWTLPYMRRAGASVPEFDLSVPGVRSVSVDLHKYGYAPKGTSLLLFSDPEYRLNTTFTYSAWPGYPVVNTTMQSTKSAGPPAAAWAVCRRIGDDGFASLVADARQATERIVDGVGSIPGLRVLGTPDATLVAVASDGDGTSGGVDPFLLADAMGKRGWFVQPQPAIGEMPRNIHLTVQATTRDNVQEFLDALAASADEVRGREWSAPPAELAAAAASLDPQTLDLQTVQNLLAFAGLDASSGPSLPEESADIQALLESLPAPLRDRLLAGYFSAIFTANR